MFDEKKVKYLSESFKELSKKHNLYYSISTQRDWIMVCCDCYNFKGDIENLLMDIKAISHKMDKDDWIEYQIQVRKDGKLNLHIFDFVKDKNIIIQDNNAISLVERYK